MGDSVQQAADKSRAASTDLASTDTAGVPDRTLCQVDDKIQALSRFNSKDANRSFLPPHRRHLPERGGPALLSPPGAGDVVEHVVDDDRLTG